MPAWCTFLFVLIDERCVHSRSRSRRPLVIKVPHSHAFTVSRQCRNPRQKRAHTCKKRRTGGGCTSCTADSNTRRNENGDGASASKRQKRHSGSGRKRELDHGNVGASVSDSGASASKRPKSERKQRRTSKGLDVAGTWIMTTCQTQDR